MTERLASTLLAPRHVALVGISESRDKTSGRPLHFLRQSGFAGTVYCVNPTRDSVQGESAWPSLDVLPECPDHVFVVAGTDAAIASVADCVRLRVPVVTVLAGGFSEAGAEGARREERLRDLIRGSATRLLGPSSIGVVNLHHRMTLTANAAFAEPGLPVGGVFCASHSGSLIGGFTSRGRARGVGFHSLVSVGNEVDLSIGEVCSAALHDTAVTGFMLFLESMRHADALQAFAMQAAERGKPVVAFKLGRSEAAAALAVSHTGALAGEDDVAQEFLADCGIARVDTFEGLLEALPMLAQLPAVRRTRRGRVGVVTTTGGGAAMAVDQLGLRGVEVVGPSAATLERLAEAGVAITAGRIVDLTLAGTRYEVMRAALDVMQLAPEFDLVLACVGSSARHQPQLAVKPVIDASAIDEGNARSPIACFIVPEAPEALLRLGDGGVPNFRTPESCGDVIAAALSRRPFRKRESTPQVDVRQGRLLDEAEAYALMATVGVKHAPFSVLGSDGKGTLPFEGPYAVKLLHAEIPHKSDVGGVVLHVADAAGVRRAAQAIGQALARHRPGLVGDRLLVQAMQRGVGEVLVGLRRDPQVGPIVVLAAGGVLTEIYRDRALRMAPVDLDTARDMIGEVRALKVLDGYRDRAPGDLDALAAAVVAVSELALRDDVLEAEINPLLVLPEREGCIAVDALVRLAR